MSAAMFATQAMAATYETEVLAGVNLRDKPSTSSSVQRLLHRGEDIHVIDKVNSYWLKVQAKDGSVGYISANGKYTDYGSSGSSSGQAYATAKGGVNLRSSPKVANNKIDFINKGDQVKVLDTVNRYWIKVSYKGKIGYASPSYFTNVPSAAEEKPDSVSASRIISTAKQYIGDFTYKFGAEPWNTNYKYSDCSSFVQLVFNKKHGYDLPRTSLAQSKEGSRVSKSSLKPGDLVFFDTNNDGKINHVGIYIGNGDFIHSSPVNKVGINDLNSGWWEDHYVTARRVL
jgi:cell wall-associated NlpC family hydrolase